MATEGMGKDYDENSTTQMAAIKSSRNYLQHAIDAFDVSNFPLILIADYGSAHGTNSIRSVESIIDLMKKSNKIDEQKQKILVIHNDLPTNHWTSLFRCLSETNSYYGLGNGRSFYEQCLPDSSLAIGLSSTALHWLSQKPCNLSDRCLVDRNRNDSETVAFKIQAANDYETFLKHRSTELMSGGVLIMSIIGDETGEDANEHVDLLYQCGKQLLTPEELLDYTFPMYFRTEDELMRNEIFTKYGFELIHSRKFNIKSPSVEQFRRGELTLDEYARKETMEVRSACEFILKQALINNGQRSIEDIENILNQYWKLHEDGIKERPVLLDQELMFFNIVLKKN